MILYKLNPAFYAENTGLVEVLDKHNGVWTGEKTRGYGIVLIKYEKLRFGLPLRSHIKHNACFRTIEDKGLDYSKAVLLVRDEYISNLPFKIPQEEFVKIADRTHFITERFDKYVRRYVLGVTKPDDNILRGYRFSTLQNYHNELGISVKAQTLD